MAKTVLIVAAHADDEALGCSGTVAKHVTNGDTVHALFMTDGVGSRSSSGKEIKERAALSQRAAHSLGISSLQNLAYPDNKMDAVPLLEVTQAVERVINEIKPDVVYTHHLGDLNIDHQVTHKAVITACRPQPGYKVNEIYAFEVLSSTEWQTPGYIPFVPNVYVDITEFIDDKRTALQAYEPEMRQAPHSRSIDNAIRLSQVRGNAIGVEYAEAFVLLRVIR